MVQTADLCGGAGACPGWLEQGGIEMRCTNPVHHQRTASASTAVLAAGISHRQFDHWSRHGLVETQASPGTGHHRTLTEHEVAVLRLMARLVRAGVQPTVAARLARHLWDAGEARLTDAVVLTWQPKEETA